MGGRERKDGQVQGERGKVLFHCIIYQYLQSDAEEQRKKMRMQDEGGMERERDTQRLMKDKHNLDAGS